MTAVCASCQASLEPAALEGLCPRCLLVRAIPLERVEDVPTTSPAAFVPPAPAELAPLFPQLEILQLLGQGGMGAVYKARQVKLDRLVALKILPPAVAKDAGFAERFTREARALARLSHPHIVSVHDFGDVNGLYFLVMEYVEGVNLRQSLGVGKLEPRQALALVGEICSALAYAHQMGVVHRDIKPENVLLDRQGRVKIADFGLAKLVGQTQSPARLTGTRQAMGTPHYMAPEQWERPLEVDHRADIYSLGVVFYELLTGELPLGKFPPPSQKAGGDARLDQVVLRAMEKEPAQRYQQMSEMKSAVESVGEAPLVAPLPPHRLAMELEVLITAAMVLGVGGALGAMWFAPPSAKEKFEPWFFFAFLFFFLFYDPENRYLKRLWSVAFLGLAAASVGGELFGRPHPLSLAGGCWVWLLFLGFFSLAGKRLVDSFQREYSPTNPPPQHLGIRPPLPGLTWHETGIIQLLQEASSDLFHGQLHLASDIEGTMLAVARTGCLVDDDEIVLAVLDLSGGVHDPDPGDPDAFPAVVFGTRALYWNGHGTAYPGRGKIPYEGLAARRFVNHGDAVFLGEGQYLSPNEDQTAISAEALTGVFYRVRDWMVAREKPSE